MANVPKKEKSSTVNGAGERAASSSNASRSSGPGEAPTGENSAPNEPTVAPAKKVRKPAVKPVARKPADKTKARVTKSESKPQPSEIAVSEDEIRLRAYFIGENRQRAGIAADPSEDWLEARRQLLEEAAART